MSKTLGLTLFLHLPMIRAGMDSDQNYFTQAIGLAWDSATAEAVVFDILLSALVVFVIRRLQNGQKLPRLSNFISKVLIVEDDYGRTLVTFIIFFLFQIIFISPFQIHTQDRAKISDLKLVTNQLGQSVSWLSTKKTELETNNAYVHDQWTAEIVIAQNYLAQIGELSRKLQENGGLATNNSMVTNSASQVAQPQNASAQNTNQAAFDLYLNQKYVSYGAIMPLDQSRKLFFQIENVGTATATNLTIIFESPINETNFVFDANWTKKQVPIWLPVNHQMYDMSDTVTMQLTAIEPIAVNRGFDVTAFVISPSLKDSSTDIEKLKRQGITFANNPASNTDPFLPVTVIVFSDNSKPQTYLINLFFKR